MDLDWTTFLLQIVNFLVLVWILKRFLYGPVTEAIARRKEAVAAVGRQAAATRESAKELEEQYRRRLEEWERGREKARVDLQRELEAERQQARAKLAEEQREEREKARVLAEREGAERQRELERTAIEQGTRFVARLLSRVAGPELEARLIDMLVEDLARLTPPEQRALGEACRDGARLELSSAFPLHAEGRDRVIASLRGVTGHDLPCEAHVDETLIAGARLGVGPWILRANLRDELEYFGEATDAAR